MVKHPKTVDFQMLTYSFMLLDVCCDYVILLDENWLPTDTQKCDDGGDTMREVKFR